MSFSVSLYHNPSLERLVPESEMMIEFVRSSGPGGQNVNKTSSKAQLHWNVSASKVFTDREKSLIKERLAHRLTKEGFIVLASDEQRSQSQNREAVIKLLRSLVIKALAPIKPRVPTKPTRGSKERRIGAKKERSLLKQIRTTRWDE
ncbi:MAG: alternative ribosome rescue aminoacyl-tRNA hydrolase ArfB [Patescibacteria group bacterium]